MLDEDDRRLGLTKHYHLVQAGDVDTLVKDVHGEDVVQATFLEFGDTMLAILDQVVPGECNSAKGPAPQVASVQLLRQCPGFRLPATEDQASRRNARLPVPLNRLEQVIDALR